VDLIYFDSGSNNSDGILLTSQPPFKSCLSDGLCPWYFSIILSNNGANTTYEDAEPAYTPTPDSL